MEEKFLRLAEKRRSVYNLGKRKILAEDEVIRLVEGMVRNCPSAFNSQSGRVVVLFGENHHKLWNIVKDTLQARVPAEAFGKTEEKINSFAAGMVRFCILSMIRLRQIYRLNFPCMPIIFRSGPNRQTAFYSIWSGLRWPKIMSEPACSIIIR